MLNRPPPKSHGNKYNESHPTMFELKLVLINDNNESIKPYTKYLHYADLSTPVTIQDKKEGTLILTYNTDKAMGFRGTYSSSNPFGEGCENYYWDSIGVNLSIE